MSLDVALEEEENTEVRYQLLVANDVKIGDLQELLQKVWAFPVLGGMLGCRPSDSSQLCVQEFFKIQPLPAWMTDIQALSIPSCCGTLVGRRPCHGPGLFAWRATEWGVQVFEAYVSNLQAACCSQLTITRSSNLHPIGASGTGATRQSCFPRNACAHAHVIQNGQSTQVKCAVLVDI